jgi:hypothetical protein
LTGVCWLSANEGTHSNLFWVPRVGNKQNANNNSTFIGQYVGAVVQIGAVAPNLSEWL